MQTILFVGLGGFLGAISRFYISSKLNPILLNFPLGTFVVNIIGSFLIGFFITFLEDSQLKPLIITGIFGALTTFSTFSLETILLFQKGDFKLGILNMSLNLFGALISTYFGLLFAEKLIK